VLEVIVRHTLSRAGIPRHPTPVSRAALGKHAHRYEILGVGAAIWTWFIMIAIDAIVVRRRFAY
jgi:hypothetical protein